MSVLRYTLFLFRFRRGKLRRGKIGKKIKPKYGLNMGYFQNTDVEIPPLIGFDWVFDWVGVLLGVTNLPKPA